MKVLKKTKVFAAFVALLMLAVTAGCSAENSDTHNKTAADSGSLKVTYIDIGQGDSVRI